jgi:hypothetical protein
MHFLIEISCINGAIFFIKFSRQDIETGISSQQIEKSEFQGVLLFWLLLLNQEIACRLKIKQVT